MTDQQKLYRVFRLLQLLSQRPYRNVPHLASVLETSRETVYKYIRLLESVGYQIDKDEHNRYFLLIDHASDHDLVDTEEAGFLQDLLWQAPAGHPLRDRILHKLNRQFTLRPLVQSLGKFQVYEHINTLGLAIESGRRVRLQNYLSGENELSHRYCEPVEFLENYAYLWAYDLERQDYRQFKLDRIGRVETLDEPIASAHESRTPDLFGWTGPRWLPVVLRLTNRAYQLLLEEYPSAKPFLRSSKGQLLFDGMVRDWRGIGRFILGLPGEIEVLEPEELLDYLQQRQGQAQWADKKNEWLEGDSR
ncbi:MAG: WYL domain-containing transcriptional regulator [Haliscomenobacter sp.]|nr:WYL domain-containing transcriptional regulator [Haliscomenobacter sp.]